MSEKTTIDKVQTKFQKLLPIESVKKPDNLFPAYVSEKYDGVFCCWQVVDGVPVIVSRTGKQYTSMRHLESQLFNVPVYMGLKESDVFILFEAYAPGVPQPTISGWCRDTVNQHPELIAKVFKVVSKEDMIVSYCTWETDVSPSVSMVGHALFASYEQAIRYAKEVWGRGGEGIVIDNPTALYQPGARNLTSVKMKQKTSFDLLVVGVEEGKGKYKGMVGALICQFGDGTEITCGGMTDSERQTWWRETALIDGKIVEVQCMKPSTDGVLREPRYKAIRFDKTEPDYSILRIEKEVAG